MSRVTSKRDSNSKLSANSEDVARMSKVSSDSRDSARLSKGGSETRDDPRISSARDSARVSRHSESRASVCTTGSPRPARSSSVSTGDTGTGSDGKSEAGSTPLSIRGITVTGGDDTSTPARNRKSIGGNWAACNKIEAIVKQMQEGMERVPIRDIRNFMSKVPSVFTGADLIQWVMKHLDCDDQVEALHLSHMICAHGYIFPIDDHALTVKNDGTYYRFQTPCLWLSRCQEPENQDYAVYLCKRTMQSKQRLELANYEAENLARLQKHFSRKWDLIYTQAETEIRTERKCDKKLGESKHKLERKVLDSQERAFWDVHRPAPGCINTAEVDIRKAWKSGAPASQGGESGKVQAIPRCPSFTGASGRQAELLAQKQYLQKQLNRRRQKVSKVGESLSARVDLYLPHDPLTSLGLPVCPSSAAGQCATNCAAPGAPNPWTSDSTELWEQEGSLTSVSPRRYKRWAYSIDELLKDPAGKELFVKYLQQSFCNENIRFWDACQALKGAPVSQVPQMIQEIYHQYLVEGAPDQVNVDSKVAEITRKNVSQPSPGRYCFDAAVEHIFNLMKNDSYTRFIRSDLYLEDQRVSRKKVSVATKVGMFSAKASAASFGSVKG